MARLLAGARVALSTTFRDRVHLPGSAWFADLFASGDTVEVRTDNAKAPLPEAWRLVRRVSTDRSDDANMATIGESFRTMPRVVVSVRAGGAHLSHRTDKPSAKAARARGLLRTRARSETAALA